MTAHVRPEQDVVDIDCCLQAWASRVIEMAIAVAHAEMMKADAVDALWSEAEHAGLIEIFGADGVQAAMALAFEGMWR